MFKGIINWSFFKEKGGFLFLCVLLVVLAIGCNSNQDEPPDDGQSDSGQTGEGTDNQNSGDPAEALAIEFTQSADGQIATLSGERLESGPNRYSFAGVAGQTLSIQVTSEPNVGFGLFLNGNQIDPTVNEGGRLEWQLPENGTYELQAFGGDPSPFTINTTLKNPVADNSGGNSGEDNTDSTDNTGSTGNVSGKVQNDGRIEFEPGATSATITGEVGAGATNTYVLQVAPDQIMTIELNGPDGAGIGLSDSEGLLLESETPVTNWTTAPLLYGGDITLTVASPNAGSYELTVTIVDSLLDKGRIEFDPGTTSKTISGEFAENFVDIYTLGAAEGQFISIQLSGDDTAHFTLRNEAEDQTIGFTSLPVANWNVGPLPTTADFSLYLRLKTPGAYEMTVTIDNTAPAIEGVPVTLNPLGEAVLVFLGADPVQLRESAIQVDGVEVFKAGESTPSVLIPYRSQTAVPIDSSTIFVGDVNFDGFTDLGIPAFTTAGSNLPLAFWLWDQSTNQFIRSEPFDALIAPTILPDKRILTRSTFGAGNVDYVLFMVGKGGPLAVARQSCEIVAADDGSTVARNIGYTIDAQGVETQTFSEDTEGCLDFKATP